MSIGNGAPARPSVIVSNGGISPSDHIIGAALSLALRHGASVVAGLMLNARRGGGRETWLRYR